MSSADIIWKEFLEYANIYGLGDKIIKQSISEVIYDRNEKRNSKKNVRN